MADLAVRGPGRDEQARPCRGRCACRLALVSSSQALIGARFLASHRCCPRQRTAHSRASALGELAAGIQVAHRAARAGVVVEDRHAVARRLGHLHAARDDGPQHLVAEVRADIVGDLIGQLGAPVVHRQDDGGDVQLRVQVRLDHLDVAQQLAHALEGVVLALDRDQHLGRGHERVDGEQAQRRRAVDEDVVEVVVLEFGERGAQPAFARHHADQFDLGARQVDGGRHAEQALAVRAALQRVLQRDLADQHLVGRRGALAGARSRARCWHCPAGRGRSPAPAAPAARARPRR